MRRSRLTVEKLQPPIMPRPDVEAIGTQYRRIPVLSVGRDIYNDTRLILRKLEQLYPSNPSISSSSLDQKAIERLLEFWAIDDGLFMRASQLIPSDMPLLKDPKFIKDREDMSGRSWNKANVEKMRPEALVDIKGAFEVLETTMLADGRDWILGGEGPSLADIQGMKSPWCYAFRSGLRTICLFFQSGTLVNKFNDSGLALPLVERSERCASNGFYLWTTVPECVRLD
jgi:glutathione S-transferase